MHYMPYYLLFLLFEADSCDVLKPQARKRKGKYYCTDRQRDRDRVRDRQTHIFLYFFIPKLLAPAGSALVVKTSGSPTTSLTGKKD